MSGRMIRLDELRLELGVAPGHEHRVEPLLRQAAALVAERLDERWPDKAIASGAIERIEAASSELDLPHQTDDEAAEVIAAAIADAVLRAM